MSSQHSAVSQKFDVRTLEFFLITDDEKMSIPTLREERYSIGKYSYLARGEIQYR